MKVTSKQVEYEFNHLLRKLKERDPPRYIQLKGTRDIKANPVFSKVTGPVASWEKGY